MPTSTNNIAAFSHALKWRVSSDAFLDVRFHYREEEGIASGLPSFSTIPDMNQERQSKRAKLGDWRQAKGMFMWFDQHLLLPQDTPIWVDVMAGIAQEAPNLQTCVLNSVANGTNGFPVQALTALIQESPFLKKLDVRCLNLMGQKQDFMDLQHALQKRCPMLEELYYVETPDWLSPSVLQNESRADMARCLVSSGVASIKRLCLRGLLFREEIAASIFNLKRCKNLEYLHIDVSLDPALLSELASAVGSLKNLSHISMRIEPGDTQSSPEEEQGALLSLIQALDMPRILVIELQLHSRVLSFQTLRPWVDHLEQSYSCQHFTVDIFGADNPKLQKEKVDQVIQTYVKLNSTRRNLLLSHFRPDLATTNCWIQLLEGLGADHNDLNSSDILTGLYLYVNQNVGFVASMLPTTNGMNRNEIATAIIDNMHEERDSESSKHFLSSQEQRIAKCLVELAREEQSSSLLWSELATVKQDFVGTGKSNENSNYIWWIDALASGYSQRAKDCQSLTIAKAALDKDLASLTEDNRLTVLR